MSDVAVVVTCFDLGRYVDEAIASVRAQTVPAAELVVVDDGSTDPFTRNRLACLEREGVRIERTPNRGVAEARNHGAALTRSPYLVFLDPDDMFEPRWLEVAAARLDADPEIGFVSCAVQRFGASRESWRPPEPDLLRIACGDWHHVSSVLRRTVFEDAGGFDPAMPAQEDLDFWIAVIERGHRGVVLDEPLFRYRTRPGSRSEGALAPVAYEQFHARCFDKHRATFERVGPDLLMAKERYLVEQRQHQRHLVWREGEVGRQLAETHTEIDRIAGELACHGLGRIDWGGLRSTAPASPFWGLDRGRPLDRYYIESFLASHERDVRGRVLEVKDPGYTRLFGGDRVVRSDVVDIDADNDRATITADLARSEDLPEDAFDCFLLTQTINEILDIRSAIANCRRVLRPGGVLLCTVSAVNRISPEGRGRDGDAWRFTEASLLGLFVEAFGPGNVEVAGYGNVLACTALLQGLAIHELTRDELDVHDPYFPLIYGVRAVRSAASPPVDRPAPIRRRDAIQPSARFAVVLAWHRIAERELDPHEICVPPDRFREQMEMLQSDFEVLPLDALAAGLANGTVPARAAAITFDDGYVDNVEVAAPLLAELGLPATFFVTGSTGDYWWDALARFLLGPDPIPAILDIEISGARIRSPLGSPTERRAAYDALWNALVRASPGERDEVLRQIHQWAGHAPGASGPNQTMGTDDLLELAGLPGVAIGAHGARHRWLPGLPEPEIRIEVHEQKSVLEALLGRPVSLFAYPFGVWDLAAARLVRDAGFAAAVTTDPGVVRAGTNRLLLPRLEVRAWTAAELARQVEALREVGPNAAAPLVR